MSRFRGQHTIRMTVDRGAAAWRAAQRQPSWIGRAALGTFLVILVLPILLLALLAIATAVVVFWVLATVNRLWRRLRGDTSGRENVIVRVRE